MTLLTGVAGTILPLMQWFNERKHKKWRIVFFLFGEIFSYVAPIVPSLASYVLGLGFYASHFPECWVSRKENGPYWTDWIGSHAIWHVCIVMAIWLHRTAIAQLTKGIGGEQCDVWGRF
jgi:adiponectin receptor